ncbi:MAG TPA: flagellar type III secretion system pore protein FliP [Isosphaeraceae bacterium]|nr:flagellar type III secretion system pore protein FliP [Isosphaeraceae bacterium]
MNQQVECLRNRRSPVPRGPALAAVLCFVVVLIPALVGAQGDRAARGASVGTGANDAEIQDSSALHPAARPDLPDPKLEHESPSPKRAANTPIPPIDQRDAARTLQTVALFGLISLAPVAVLMVTAFVRINIVLILLRQALGSPQVPGNQVLTALALLLTALVMRPKGEEVYNKAIRPYAAGEVTASQAWKAGTQPIKAFMVDQIVLTRHQDYLQALADYAVPQSPGQIEAEPASAHEFPLRVVAPAYLLSELTTALMMGFYLYLPFLVIDLVVSSVLAATGLFMLPPALVATPVKLIVFVLADGWLLVATMLLSSFGGAQ